MLADPNLRVATIAPRALHAEVRDPLGPAARWTPLQLCWDACIVGRAPSATRLVCLTRLLWGVKAIKFAGRAAGRGRPACRPETEARALSRELNLVAPRLEVRAQFQAAVAARHVRKASSLRTRSVRREVRWRWTLNVLCGVNGQEALS